MVNSSGGEQFELQKRQHHRQRLFGIAHQDSRTEPCRRPPRRRFSTQL